MKHKSFIDIENANADNIGEFKPGDEIIIQEKIDGANAAIRFDRETKSVVAQSRKNILNCDNNLRGFYEWCQTTDAGAIEAALGDNYILFGEWLCLSGDTIIRKTSAGKNNNYMTLREMYEYRHKPRPDRIHQRLDRGRPFIIKNIIDNPNISDKALFSIHCNKYYANYKKIINWLLKEKYIIYNNDKYIVTTQGINWYNHYVKGDSWWDRNGMPSLFSLDFKTDKIIPNKMVDIIYSGDKEVYQLKTRKGYTIKATLEHPFLAPKGFVPLKELKIFDCIAITDLISGRRHRRLGKGSRTILNKMNNYKKNIGKCEICGTTQCLECHHIDGNYLNNEISNYMVLCSDCHKGIHSKDNSFKGFEYSYDFDYIVSIKYVGIEDCYDIAMNGDETTANFVANGFIVHNCKHTVVYPDDRYGQFYAYDIYSLTGKTYLPQHFVRATAQELGINYAPVFYEGGFTSWDDCKQYVGRTGLGGEYGEGIVVKNQTLVRIATIQGYHYVPESNFNANWTNGRDIGYVPHEPFYLKIVGEKFKETKPIKKKKQLSPEDQAAYDEAVAKTESIVTPARTEKILHKLVDEGILPEKWQDKDLKTVAQNLPKRMFEDCLKEEKALATTIPQFSKLCSKVCMQHARDILNKRTVL